MLTEHTFGNVFQIRSYFWVISPMPSPPQLTPRDVSEALQFEGRWWTGFSPSGKVIEGVHGTPSTRWWDIQGGGGTPSRTGSGNFSSGAAKMQNSILLIFRSLDVFQLNAMLKKNQNEHFWKKNQVFFNTCTWCLVF